VLVIDDDQTSRDLIAQYLGDQGIRVITAKGGLEGLQRARELKPSAITLDVMMSDLSGWAVLAELKADPELASIPVVMASVADEQRKGLALGAADYLTKPINPETLTRSVGRFLRSPAGTRVLIVEDAAAQRAVARAALETKGCVVSEAPNGRAALEKLRQEGADLILLDLIMPEMDGFEFAAALRANPQWKGIPVVVLTSKELSAEERERLKASVSQVLIKHEFNSADLIHHVRSAMNGARPN
jgi:CheY-like chemotaxis protein